MIGIFCGPEIMCWGVILVPCQLCTVLYAISLRGGFDLVVILQQNYGKR